MNEKEISNIDESMYYGYETINAMNNFDLKNKKTNMELIYAIVTVKKAVAKTYIKLEINKDIYTAIDKACDYILQGKYDGNFKVEALQGGAGTSTNMNVNEVIASVALEILGKDIHDYNIINPIDDVNKGQSTNDVYPTALRIACIKHLRTLSEECAKLQEALQNKEQEYADIEKIGRTQLMDAVKITLGEEFGAYAQCIARDRWRIYKIEERLRQVNIGGTAIGNSINANRKYMFEVIEQLRQLTGMGLARAEYPIDITQNNDVFVEVSGLLKALAVNLSKIAGDLRLMNSGPNGGIGEIKLKSMQMGSTIMPGKVNPVIPEMIMEIAIKVMANDYAITMAASRGEFELNAFLPLIADCILENLRLLINGVKIFREKCIEVLESNEKRCRENLNNSYWFATEYVPVLGYTTVANEIKNNCVEDNETLNNRLKQMVEELNNPK